MQGGEGGDGGEVCTEGTGVVGQGQAGPRWAAGEERVAAELAQDGYVDLGCCCTP